MLQKWFILKIQHENLWNMIIEFFCFIFPRSILVSFGVLQTLILKEGSIYLKNLPAFSFLVGLHGLDMDTLITG